MSTFALCQDCSGEIIVGEFEPITVAVQDADGFPILDNQAQPLMTTLKLPSHRANTTFARLVFDPTGFAPAPCPHGLPAHPEGITHPWAVSWIRAKYLDVNKGGVTCPVCRGEPAPADMLIARNAA